MLTIIKGSKGTHSIIDMFELLVDTTLFVSRAPCVSRATVDVTLEMSMCRIALSRLVGWVQVGAEVAVKYTTLTPFTKLRVLFFSGR